jgi:sugar phosphate isomerase/epimerase
MSPENQSYWQHIQHGSDRSDRTNQDEDRRDMNQTHEMRVSRREAMATMGFLAAACCAGRNIAAEPAKKPKISLQLYTMREPAKADLAGTLKRCHEMGWEYVQWSGMPSLPAEEIRKALDTAGLKALACHCGIEPFETDFDGQVKFWKTVGVEQVGPGGMMRDCQATLADWLKGAKRFDTLGAKLRGVGLSLAYHNHAGEFEKYEGDPRSKLDILYESTDPKNLHAELDLAWVQVAGVDPAAYIRKYAHRCPMVHAKDVAKEKRAGGGVQFVPLGQGVLKWDEIFAAGKEAGIEVYTYEQDNCQGDIFDAAKASFDFLSKHIS